MRRLERIEYKPISARELFLEMKNLSELMIDLAYSAALFSDRDLADHVLELENRVDSLAYLLEMEIMVATRDPKDAEALLEFSIAASAANKISDAAADIAAIVKQNLGVHPIVTEIFERVEERLVQTQVGEGSVLGDKQLSELDLAARMGVDIIAIHRNGSWVINPKETERIGRGDVLFVRGAHSGIEEFTELAEGKRRELEDYGLSRRREKQFEEIVERFVELKDTSELMIDLAYSSVLLNSRELAEEVQRLEERVDELHTDFELLVLSSKFQKADVRGLLGLIRLGVVAEKIADSAYEIAAPVLRGIEPHPVLKLALEEAEETVTYVGVAEDSPLVGKTLKEARIPYETGMWVLAVRRGDRCMRPRREWRIQAGDVLIASGYSEGEEDLMKLASPSSAVVAEA